MGSGRDQLAAFVAALERDLVDPEVGLVTRLLEVPVEPTDPQLFVFGTTLGDAAVLFQGGRLSACGGAAVIRAEAKAAALGESIERYCSCFADSRRFLEGSFADLHSTSALLPPARLPLFDLTQYEYLPYGRFSETSRIAWTKGQFMVTATPIWVPSCLVYMNYRPSTREEIIGPATSTGTACALSTDQALLTAVCEVIERDAFTIVWENRLPLPRIQVQSDPELFKVYKERLHKAGLSYYLFDMTLDIPVPCMLALLIDEREKPPLICVGAAAHLDLRRAALKALTEASHTLFYARYLRAQGSSGVSASGRDLRTFADHVLLYAEQDMSAAVQFLVQPSATRTFDEVKEHLRYESAGNVKQDLAHLIAELKARGMDVIAIDLTTSDVSALGFRVMRAMIPGMQQLNGDHRERFLGNPRLYELPVALGLREAKASIRDLNPYPHPFP